MSPQNSIIFTIAVLTYNRKDVLAELLPDLAKIDRDYLEILVVDNGSIDGTREFVSTTFPEFRLISLERNLGIVGRNKALISARGKYTITLDDDILGLNKAALNHIRTLFESNPAIGAICFKVSDFYSGVVCNWCHPNRPEEFSDRFFETCEITEGAVAFRNEMLDQIGLYPERYFISHEGSDLAARILDHGYEIYYTPAVAVRHKYALEGRKRWRRYYYDTRNSFWLAIRNYRFMFAIAYLTKRIPITLIYSLRDGFVLHWVRAIKDAMSELPEMINQRRPISVETERKIRRLNRSRPGLFYYMQKRLFSKEVRI